MRSACIAVMLAAVAAAACSKTPGEYTAAGDRKMAEKEYAEALVQYRNAAKTDANSGELRMKLTDAYLHLGDGRNALKEAARAADLMPDSVEAQLRAATLLLQANRFEDAKARVMAVLQKEPRNSRALMLLGNALAGLKDLDGAIQQVEDAIDTDPRYTLSYSNLGALLLVKGDSSAAEGAFRRAIEIDPTSVAARLALANFLWSTGKRDEVEQELKTVLSLDPKSPEANRALAALYFANGKRGEAEPFLRAFADASGNGPSRLLLADYYMSMGRIGEARGVLDPLLQDRQARVRATVRLASLDVAEKKPKEAYARLDALLKEAPKNAEILEAKARLFMIDNRNAEALALTRVVVDANPKSSSGRYLHASALAATGSVDEAIKVLQDLLNAEPGSPRVTARLAALNLARQRPKEALPYALAAVKATPRSAEAHLLYAQSLLKSGDIDAAERELTALEKVAPSSPDVHAWLGLTHEKRHNLQNARRSYEQALKLSPQLRIALAGLVSVDLAEGKGADAIARLSREVNASPSDVELLSMSGLAYLAVRDLPRAEAAYRKVIDIDPNNLDAYGRLAGLFIAQNRLDDARRNFEELAKQPARAVLAETMLGNIYASQKNMAEARKHFERALQLNPRAAVAANNLAWDYATSGGNLEQALQLAQGAKAVLPTNPDITDTLGWVYYKKGMTALAVSTLKEAAQQNPASAGIRYRLGLALLQSGQKSEAKASLLQVLKLNPKFPEAAEVNRLLSTLQV